MHEVTISQGFYLGKYEVTQGQWESVMGTRPWQGSKLCAFGIELSCGICIMVENAQEFIHRLNTSLGSKCVSFANRGGVGVCVSGWNNDALVFW